MTFRSHSLLALLALSGCTIEHADTRYCGESFCIRLPGGELPTKAQPTGDFNVYRLTFNGRTYGIYEGNNPMPAGQLVRRLSAPAGAQTASLFQDRDKIEVRYERAASASPFRLGETTRPPRFIGVWTECPGNGDCDIEELSSRIEISVQSP